LLFHKFVHKWGLHQLLKHSFKTTDKANRQHLDDEILLQKIYQISSGHFTDNVSAELSTAPFLLHFCEKTVLLLSLFSLALDLVWTKQRWISSVKSHVFYANKFIWLFIHQELFGIWI